MMCFAWVGQPKSPKYSIFRGRFAYVDRPKITEICNIAGAFKRRFAHVAQPEITAIWNIGEYSGWRLGGVFPRCTNQKSPKYAILRWRLIGVLPR